MFLSDLNVNIISCTIVIVQMTNVLTGLVTKARKTKLMKCPQNGELKRNLTLFHPA